GHKVRCYDSLRFGGDALLPFFRNRNFEFVRGDVRDGERLRQSLRDVDFIVHLAAIVGYPACKKESDLAEQINVGSCRTLATVRAPSQGIIYASTGSSYGALIGELCTEETPTNPLTVYGRTKAEGESILLNAGGTTAYRFATAFGLSPRLRLDLLVNDFCYQAVRNRSLVIYEAHFKRTFIHVADMARALIHAMDNYSKMKDNVYNCGDNRLNASKMEVAELVRSYTEFYVHAADIGKDEDARNYEVSYAKLNATGFKCEITLEEGIKEMVRA